MRDGAPVINLTGSGAHHKIALGAIFELVGYGILLYTVPTEVRTKAS